MIPLMIIIAICFLGLVLGSFVNAFVWRLHEQEALKGKKRQPSTKQLQALSISRGRSMCPNCKHELAPKDLIPVFSWLYLRGKCRYCQRPISWQYPLIELLTAAVFGLSYVFWPFDLSGAGLFQFIFFLGFLVMFMALAIYDLRWYLLPNQIVYPLIAVAALETVIASVWNQSLAEVWQAALAAVIIAGLFWILFQVSDGKWIGGGDVKLAVILGLLAGTPAKACLLVFLASLLGTILSLPLAIRQGGNFKLKVPFGPFLILACVLTVLFGQQILDWYTGILL